MNKYSKMIPYLLVNIFGFYILPMMIRDTGSGMFVMLIVLLLLCFVTATVFGIRNSFVWAYPIAVALLFLPTIFIFYNMSATVYTAVYGIIALIGNLIGTVIYKLIKKG